MKIIFVLNVMNIIMIQKEMAYVYQLIVMVKEKLMKQITYVMNVILDISVRKVYVVGVKKMAIK